MENDNELNIDKRDDIQSFDKMVVLKTESCHATAALLTNKDSRKTRLTEHGLIIMSLTAYAEIEAVNTFATRASNNGILNETIWLAMEMIANNRKGNGSMSIVEAIETAVNTLLPIEPKV